jgi:parallel beta-helix repeat protein
MRRKRSFEANVEVLDSRALLSALPTVTIPASLGNGLTNAQPAIQTAINSVAKTGGIVVIPAGTYELATSTGGAGLNLATGSNITIEGAGASTVLQVAPGVEMSGVQIGSYIWPPHGNTISQPVVSNDTVENLTLKGQFYNDNGTGMYHGVALTQGNNILLSSLSIQDWQTDGICQGDAAVIPSNNISITNCTINNCGRNGISILNANGVKITNNQITNCPYDDGNLNISGGSPEGGIPIDLEVGISVYLTNLDQGTSYPTAYINNVTITGNTLETVPGAWSATGINENSYYGPISKVTFTDNTITGVPPPARHHHHWR